ncbi:MAG: DUF2461 domain-containing protein [Saprospiraceae bacterium]
MSTTAISKSTFDFLKDLAKNNNREWFNEHKDRYLAEQAKVIGLADQILTEVSKVDVLEPSTGKKSLFRIYRDVRFSKNKAPYKVHFSGQMKRATAYRRGGYYFHFEPGGKTMIAGGFWAPNSADLKRMRTEVAVDPESVRKIISAPAFVKTFGGLKGDQVKTAPRGYTVDHPAIDLLRYKQYLLMREFTDKEAMAPDFLEHIVETFKNMLPFFNHMSMVLTTDANGVPIEGL